MAARTLPPSSLRQKSFGKFDMRSMTSIDPSLTEDTSNLDFAMMSTCYSKIGSIISRAEGKLGQWIFPTLPSHYTLRKKLLVTKSVTEAWAVYDIIQILLIILFTVLYILLH